MKHILITGENSYIGKNLKNFLFKDLENYTVTTITLKNELWRNMDFSKYDVVVHLSAIVHKKEQKDMELLYSQVNTSLTIDVAKKSKMEGVSQFIFMSTMAVYGEVGSLSKTITINENTPEYPKSFYAISKLKAEKELIQLDDTSFKVTILRPPMVYGDNCTGNYAKLKKLALILPIFPLIENERSVIHVNKLCEYIKYYIDENMGGVFLPQDNRYMHTSYLVKDIASEHNKNIHLSKTLGFFITLLFSNVSIVKKIFGSLVYKE